MQGDNHCFESVSYRKIFFSFMIAKLCEVRELMFFDATTCIHC